MCDEAWELTLFEVLESLASVSRAIELISLAQQLETVGEGMLEDLGRGKSSIYSVVQVAQPEDDVVILSKVGGDTSQRGYSHRGGIFVVDLSSGDQIRPRIFLTLTLRS